MKNPFLPRLWERVEFLKLRRSLKEISQCVRENNRWVCCPRLSGLTFILMGWGMILIKAL